MDNFKDESLNIILLVTTTGTEEKTVILDFLT